MNGFTIPDWPFHVVGWAVLLLGFAACAWGVFWDRARGRMRCPRCWYDMSGVAAGQDGYVCPECGARARRVSQLLRTRTSWKRVSIGIVVCTTGWMIGRVPSVRQSGIVAWMPSFALIAWTARNDSTPVGGGRAAVTNGATKELARRAKAGELWNWELRLILDSNRAVEVPSVWPKGRPLALRCHWGNWLWSEGVMLSMGLEEPGGFVNGARGLTLAGVLPAEADGVNIKFLLTNGKTVELTKRYAIHQVDRPEDCLTVYEGKDADAAVRQSFSLSYSWIDTDGAPHGLEVLQSSSQIPDDVALGFEVTILDRGVAVASGMFGPGLQRNNAHAEPLAAFEKLNWNLSDHKERDRWRVRVRSTSDVGVLDVGQSRMWRGEFEVPLLEVLRVSGNGEKSGT